MKALVFLFLGFALVSCGEKDQVDEQIELNSFKEKLSYCLGAEQARMITESGDPNLGQLDFEGIFRGFAQGLNAEDQFEDGCRDVLSKMYGPYGQDLDTTMIGPGSECIGRISGNVFFLNWSKKEAMDKIDLEKAEIGFKHGLQKRDTLVAQAERAEMVSNLIFDLNKKFGSRMMTEAAKSENARELDGGIIIQTLEAGKGKKPSPTDDVDADYILINSYGDTIESSFEYKKRSGKDIPAFNLTEVIPGWTQAFQELNSGGKYRLFIPWDLAYGAERGFESLCFYVEFKKCGPQGSLVLKPTE
jgi:FKBP-type peptidyl-prolyl cis-trans isomerase FkpA